MRWRSTPTPLGRRLVVVIDRLLGAMWCSVAHLAYHEVVRAARHTWRMRCRECGRQWDRLY